MCVLYLFVYYVHVHFICVKTFYKIFVLHDMHMILGSLELDFKCALIDTKISQIACWEHNYYPRPCGRRV